MRGVETLEHAGGHCPPGVLTLLLVGVVDPVAVRDTAGVPVLAPEGVGVAPYDLVGVSVEGEVRLDVTEEASVLVGVPGGVTLADGVTVATAERVGVCVTGAEAEEVGVTVGVAVHDGQKGESPSAVGASVTPRNTVCEGEKKTTVAVSVAALYE